MQTTYEDAAYDLMRQFVNRLTSEQVEELAEHTDDLSDEDFFVKIVEYVIANAEARVERLRSLQAKVNDSLELAEQVPGALREFLAEVQDCGC